MTPLEFAFSVLTLIYVISAQEVDESVQRFAGNQTDSDHFKLLVRDGDNLLVGARNIVYNVSLISLEENKRLQWYSTDDDIRMCKYKGKSEDACQNYIRVLAKKSEDSIFVCGTNAFKPKCRLYFQNNLEYDLANEQSGEGLCPYDSTHMSTATFFGNVSDDNLYVATVAGFNGADPLIYRSPLRTEQFNPKHLNAPSFVNSFPHNEYVYFFFRETAVEYINCGKTVYSRVARVCSKDKGGPHKFRNHWTTFVKARLNCSIPGEFPFYFNEIQSTTGIVKGVYGGHNAQLVYAVFNTPPNSISGSAVCAFRMEDIYKAFDGQFKGQENIDSNWLPVQNSKVPEPRPGLCVNDSRQLPEMTLNFIKEHTLMDTSVSPFWGSPVVIQTSFKYRLTHIAVDPQIESAYGKTYDVLFIGTDDGRVMKAINAASSAVSGHRHNSVVPVIIDEVVVFPSGTPITNLMVYHTYYEAKLIVVSAHEIRAIKLYHCKAKTCGKCVALQDPYCAFDLQRQQCTSSRSRFWNRENFVQNVEDGWDPRCPDGRPPPTDSSNRTPSQSHHSTSIFDEPNDPHNSHPGLTASQQPPYNGETFALAVVTSVVTSLVVGFIFGYIFSRRCRKEDPNVCSPYDDPHQYLDQHHSDTFPSGPGVNNKPINLVLNVPPKNAKNANSSADNKPIQKVKKIYL